MLRVLLGVNALAALAALLLANDLPGWKAHYIDLASLVEPLLLFGLGVLALLRNLLWRLPLRLGQMCVLVIFGALAQLLLQGAWSLNLFEAASPWRFLLLTWATTGLLLGYFELRSRAFSPAQAEARLAALNARIRPHFLFNSLNAVLSLIRARPSQAEARLAALNARIRPHFLFNSLNAVLSLIRARPQQAEAALESLSDLFRAAMRDPGELVSLADEIDLGRQYLELEKLRLGERLHVDWQLAGVPMDLPIPPLMLQPLLENAVYHGIEPSPEGGAVTVAIRQVGEELRIVISNPTAGQLPHAAGNQMALANIRERLALYYDLEARLETEAGDHRYDVRITLPCKRKTL